MPHPNRGGKGARTNPTTAEIREARTRAGLTEEQAAELIHGSASIWRDCEAGTKNMHPGLFELFRIKTGQDERFPLQGGRP